MSVDSIRKEYRRDWTSREMKTRQRGVALYFIDKVCLYFFVFIRTKNSKTFCFWVKYLFNEVINSTAQDDRMLTNQNRVYQRVVYKVYCTEMASDSLVCWWFFCPQSKWSLCSFRRVKRLIIIQWWSERLSRRVCLCVCAQLALRAGNEKDDESADTVGCCSLRVEHISLHRRIDGQEFVVEFDFLGKDSIRYYNKVPVEKQVTTQTR